MTTVGSKTFLSLVAGTRLPYMLTRLRVRQWGTLPLERGPTVIIANHQHEDEAENLILRTFVQVGREPLLTASTKRMYEPGFFAERMPWSASFTRKLNAAPMFYMLGMLPIENELNSQPLGTLARDAEQRHGDLLLLDVFKPEAIASLAGRAERLSDVERPEFFSVAAPRVKLGMLNDPYRKEAVTALREGVAHDIARMVELLSAGATFFITPEGRYSVDGRLQPLRGIVTHLTPIADVWFCAVSYDPWRGHRLSMLYRLLKPFDKDDLATSLQASRPVTTTALLAHRLTELGTAATFTRIEMIDAIARRRSSLPPGLFVDPELLSAPDHCVNEALAALVRRGVLTRDDETMTITGRQLVDERFAGVTDQVAYHTVFLDETIDAAKRLAARGTPGFG